MTMREQAEWYKDNEHYDRAVKALEVGFLDNVRTLEEADEALRCLESAQQLIGPCDLLYRKALGELRRTLESTVMGKFIPARGFDTAITELQVAWSQAMELLIPYAPQDIQDQVGSLMRALFDGIREDLAK